MSAQFSPVVRTAVFGRFFKGDTMVNNSRGGWQALLRLQRGPSPTLTGKV